MVSAACLFIASSVRDPALGIEQHFERLQYYGFTPEHGGLRVPHSALAYNG